MDLWEQRGTEKRRDVYADGSLGGVIFREMCRNRWRLVRVCRLLSKSTTRGTQACRPQEWFASIYNLRPGCQGEVRLLKQFRTRLLVSQAGATARLLQKELRREEELHAKRAKNGRNCYSANYLTDPSIYAAGEVRTDSVDNMLMRSLVEQASDLAE